MEYYSAMKRRNPAMCNNMDEPREMLDQQNKPDKDKRYMISFICGIQKSQIYKSDYRKGSFSISLNSHREPDFTAAVRTEALNKASYNFLLPPLCLSERSSSSPPPRYLLPIHSSLLSVLRPSRRISPQGLCSAIPLPRGLPPHIYWALSLSPCECLLRATPSLSPHYLHSLQVQIPRPACPSPLLPIPLVNFHQLNTYMLFIYVIICVSIE